METITANNETTENLELLSIEYPELSNHLAECLNNEIEFRFGNLTKKFKIKNINYWGKNDHARLYIDIDDTGYDEHQVCIVLSGSTRNLNKLTEIDLDGSPIQIYGDAIGNSGKKRDNFAEAVWDLLTK